MINIIVAMTKDRVIGKRNALPWYIPDDLKNFKKLTSGNTIMMGRKTFESIGKPLPNRNNIVISSSMQPVQGVDVCKDVNEALEKAKSYGKEIFVIGGAQIFEQTMDLVDKMYISHVKKDYEGDVRFPEVDLDGWNIESRQDFPDFVLVIYVKR